MTIYWKVDTHGDPIGAIQAFIQKVWEQQKLDAMLVFANGQPSSHLIEDKAALAHLNPFQPLMKENMAAQVRSALTVAPGKHPGVLLRPCEMRTLVELMRDDSFPDTRLTTMCVDCLGTFPEGEYQWRVSRKSSHEQLANEALQFARQGGVLAYRYRAACQICPTPGSLLADVNIHVFGLPIRKQVLVESKDDKTSRKFNMRQISDGPAEEELILQYEQMLAKQKDYHLQTTERVMQVLEDLLPRNLEALAAELESCPDCQRCMEVCPLFVNDLPVRDKSGHYPIGPLGRWMLACTGCGVCEQECKRNLPLTVIFRSIKEKKLVGREYTPGV